MAIHACSSCQKSIYAANQKEAAARFHNQIKEQQAAAQKEANPAAIQPSTKIDIRA